MQKHGLSGSAYSDGTRVSVHRLAVYQGGRLVAEFNATAVPPWLKKADSRRKAKAARLSRRKNR